MSYHQHAPGCYAFHSGEQVHCTCGASPPAAQGKAEQPELFARQVLMTEGEAVTRSDGRRYQLRGDVIGQELASLAAPTPPAQTENNNETSLDSMVADASASHLCHDPACNRMVRRGADGESAEVVTTPAPAASREALRELIADWRRRIETPYARRNMSPYGQEAVRTCADELEAALLRAAAEPRKETPSQEAGAGTEAVKATADVQRLLCTACKTAINTEAWQGECPTCGNGTMREL